MSSGKQRVAFNLDIILLNAEDGVIFNLHLIKKLKHSNQRSRLKEIMNALQHSSAWKRQRNHCHALNRFRMKTTGTSLKTAHIAVAIAAGAIRAV